MGEQGVRRSPRTDGLRGKQRRAHKIGVVLLLSGGALMFAGSVLSLVVGSVSWWWVAFALAGLLYLAMGLRQLRRHRAGRAVQRTGLLLE